MPASGRDGRLQDSGGSREVIYTFVNSICACSLTEVWWKSSSTIDSASPCVSIQAARIASACRCALNARMQCSLHDVNVGYPKHISPLSRFRIEAVSESKTLGIFDGAHKVLPGFKWKMNHPETSISN
jgi:hypothetical protein